MSGRLVDTFKRTLSSQKSSSRSVRSSQHTNIAHKSQNGNSLSGNSGFVRTGLTNPVMSEKMTENVRNAYSSSREAIRSSVAEVGRLGYASRISDFFANDFGPSLSADANIYLTLALNLYHHSNNYWVTLLSGLIYGLGYYLIDDEPVLSSEMDSPNPRASRGAREPVAPVRRLESVAGGGSWGGSSNAVSRPGMRATVDVTRTLEDLSLDVGHKRSTDLGLPSPTGAPKSFDSLRATVVEDRRREQRTPSTAPAPTASALRKAAYLKTKQARVATNSSTRAHMATPSTWVAAGPRAVSVRHKHTCVAIQDDEVLLFYGGCTNAGTAPAQTLLTYNIITRNWNTPIPRKRIFSDGVGEKSPRMERSGSNVVVANSNIVEDAVPGMLEVQSESGSTKLISSQFENRIGHTATLVGRTTIFIFGGQISTGGTSTLLTNSMLAYDVERNEWWSVDCGEPAPTPRRGHSAVLVNDALYIFGGCGANSEPLNDLWKFTFTSDLSGRNCGSWQKQITYSGGPSDAINSSSPSPRFFHACEAIDSTMYVFGGQDGNRDLGDFYALNLKNLRWSTVELSGETTIKPGSKSGARLLNFESKLLLLGGSQPLDDYALDIYVFYPKKAAWYLQRYDMESDEPKVDTGGSSPPPTPPMLGTAHTRDTYHGQSSDVLLSNRYSRIDSSPQIMTVDKRNRIFHSVAMIKTKTPVDSIPGTPTSPLIASPRGGGALSPSSSTSNNTPTPPHQCHLFVFGGVNQMLANVLDQFTLEFSDLTDLFASLSSTGGFYFGDPGSVSATSTSSLLSSYSKDDEDLFLNLPKEDWEAAALYYNPEILALSERVRMLTGETSFAKLPDNSGRTQALSTLSSHDVLTLIMEWLSQNGYRSTIQRLERDTRQPFIRSHDTKSASALESLVSFAKRRIKRGTSIWDDHVLAIVASGGQALQNTSEPTSSGLLTQPSIVAPIVQCIDHLPDWYHSQSKDIILSQNPWDEAVVVDDNLKLEIMPTTGQPKIMFASVNALVILTLDYTNFVSEHAAIEEIDDYISTFFHSYHSFATPIVLLEKYIQLFEVPESTSVPEDAISAHRRKIIEIILVWIDLASWDWANEYLTQKLKDFVDGPLVNTDLRWMAPQVKSALSIALDFSNSPAYASDSALLGPHSHLGGTSHASANQLANQGKVKSHAITTRQLMAMAPLPGTQRLRMGLMEQLDEPPEPIVRKSIFSAQHSLDDVPEIEIARQLTIMQFSLFCMIKPSEFLNGWWKSEDAEYRSPHLRVCLNRATVVSDWVVQAIARPGDDRKARGKAVERFFKIAVELRALQNFETLSQILQGLKHAPEDLLERIDRKHLETLYKLDSSTTGHNEAIDALDADLIPCIPNLKLVLKQIAKIEDSAQLLVVQPTKLGRTLVNVHKCRSLHNILRKILSLQSRFYNLLPVYQIISPLRNPSGSSAEAAATASLRIMLQPRVQ